MLCRIAVPTLLVALALSAQPARAQYTNPGPTGGTALYRVDSSTDTAPSVAPAPVSTSRMFRLPPALAGPLSWMPDVGNALGLSIAAVLWRRDLW